MVEHLQLPCAISSANIHSLLYGWERNFHKRNVDRISRLEPSAMVSFPDRISRASSAKSSLGTSSNLTLVRQSRRVLPIFLCISMYGQGGHKLEINIPPQQIFARGGLIIEGRNFE